MAVELTRRVDYPMIDGANIAYYPRIYDLSHRFFEESWEEICGIDYPQMINEMRIGFSIVHAQSDFMNPIKYGDTITCKIWISRVGEKSCTWQYRMRNQHGVELWNSEHVTVCVDMDSMQSKPIPAALRTGLEACGDV